MKENSYVIHYSCPKCILFCTLLLCLYTGVNVLYGLQRINSPYQTDSATVLLLHLDGNFNNAASGFSQSRKMLLLK